MKVYTFFTDSHRVFLPFFLDSFPFEDGLNLEIKYFPQECENGEYHSNGWKKTMERKVEYILYSLENTNDGEYFIHSDIDIQFFGKIKNDLETLVKNTDKDILFQNDGIQVCMGFFICRKNEKTFNFFKKILSELHNHRDDQYAANYFLNEMNIFYDKLPERYYTIGIQHGVWDGNLTDFYVPNDILMHHANFTVGVDNKIKLLKLIKEKNEN